MSPKSQGATAVLAVVLSVSAAQVAWSHTPYLLPNTFDAERDHITLQASLTEDDYFSPDIGLKTNAYVETLPNGENALYCSRHRPEGRRRGRGALEATGTYRFSTGQFIARSSKMALIEGRWVRVRPAGMPAPRETDHASGADGTKAGQKSGEHAHGDEPHNVSEAELPAGAQTMLVDNVLTAETYVSKGAPTLAALATSGKGLELKPFTHPDSIYVDQGFAFKFLLDGVPAAGVPISVYRSGDVYDDKKITAELKTDASGAAKVSFERPGVYLLTAHSPATRVDGAAPAARNYVYSLTFEVTR